MGAKVEMPCRAALSRHMNGRVFAKAAGAAACVIWLDAGAQVVPTPDRFGDAMQYLLPAAAIGLTLHQGDREGLEQFAYSAVLSQGSTVALGAIVNSPRPDGGSRGFPSGHTSIAFVSAAYVHQRYGLWPAIPMYGLATLTGYSRVRTHHHFTKDVIGGAAVGIGSAFLLTHRKRPAMTP